jgi:hypothetical protein
MKKLFYCVSSLHNPHAGVMLNKILSDKKKGIDVVMAYCDRALPSCITNIHGNKGICLVCKYMHKQIIKRYLSDTPIIAISNGSYDEKDMFFPYEDVYDLKKIVYRDINIGLSLHSYYVTITRRPSGTVSLEERQYFNQMLSYLCGFVDYAYSLVDKIKPNVITIYNGRMFENRLFYEIAVNKGIAFESEEVCWRIDNPSIRVEYHGSLPLDIKQLTQMSIDLWKNSKRSEKEKIEVGSSFFWNRRNGKPTNDFIYTDKQINNLLPEEYNEKERNFVVFNSSEDEKVSLGGDWDEDNLFNSQIEAIRFVIEHLPGNSHLYLRIHPNLKGLNVEYHTGLYKFKDKRITIIPPESPISSYALMDISEKVIVMGSTMGVESCFWGKPVISLHKSEYHYLNVAYNPQSKSELISLLEANLMPKNIKGALLYGFFYMALDERALTDNPVEFNPYTVKFMGKKVTGVIEYLKLCGSSVLFRLIYPRFVAHCTRFFKNTVSFPG